MAFVQPSLFQARTTMLVNSGRFRCPSCRHEVVLDRHGVYGLQRNLLVENIIDIYKQENTRAASPVSPPPLPAELSCSDHEGEKVNIYCLTCQVPTCSLCKVFGGHQSCQVAPLTDVFQKQKEVLGEGVTSLEAFSEKLRTHISDLQETCRHIEENSKTQKQIVCEKFDRMVSILNDRRKVMMQQISNEEDEKTRHTRMLLRCYGDSVEANNKLLERARSSSEELDMADFIQNSRELCTKVKTASGLCPPEPLKLCYENLSTYRFSFSEQERALRSLDFIKAAEEVPKEPKTDPEPDEPEEPPIQTDKQEQEKISTESQESFSELCHQTEPLQPPQTGGEEEGEASTPPAPVEGSAGPGGGQDGGLGGGQDGGKDGGKDGGPDGGPDGGQDGGPDGGQDGGPDGGQMQDVQPQPEAGLEQIHEERKNEEEEEEREEAQQVEERPVLHPVKTEAISEQQGGMETREVAVLLFYLFALLVILQRVWAYVGFLF
ncbi:tripartite motif-containing protein 54 isoform X2 [Oryzias melastigma]|uniref:tripartite motif-containing protein 54 isoform X2 n=1 Tax=Oryzias melastigma TaxID=30732 RepID=UPI00168D6459|nr:tripartite motif-containing protein 54 isoform X2 [Oryzias melastigma]